MDSWEARFKPRSDLIFCSLLNSVFFLLFIWFFCLHFPFFLFFFPFFFFINLCSFGLAFLQLHGHFILKSQTSTIKTRCEHFVRTSVLFCFPTYRIEMGIVPFYVDLSMCNKLYFKCVLIRVCAVLQFGSLMLLRQRSEHQGLMTPDFVGHISKVRRIAWNTWSVLRKCVCSLLKFVFNTFGWNCYLTILKVWSMNVELSVERTILKEGMSVNCEQ